jgi:hypothetical protein
MATEPIDTNCMNLTRFVLTEQRKYPEAHGDLSQLLTSIQSAVKVCIHVVSNHQCSGFKCARKPWLLKGCCLVPYSQYSLKEDPKFLPNFRPKNTVNIRIPDIRKPEPFNFRTNLCPVIKWLTLFFYHSKTRHICPVF